MSTLLLIISATLIVMPGIDFTNHSCWDFKTLVVEGGMWIECTGKNLPKAGEEPYYMVEIKDFKRGFDTNPNCLLGTDVRSFSSQFKFAMINLCSPTQTSEQYRTSERNSK